MVALTFEGEGRPRGLGFTNRMGLREAKDFRLQIQLLRKDVKAIEEQISWAKEQSWVSPVEAIQPLAIAEGMCAELERRIHELTKGYDIERPTTKQIVWMLEARERERLKSPKR